jgi:hypothetical protein
MPNWKSYIKSDPTDWLLEDDNPSVKYSTLIDILEILDILTKLKIKDERMQDAVDIVVSKQDKQGRWNLQRTFNGRFVTNVERKDKPSK